MLFLLIHDIMISVAKYMRVYVWVHQLVGLLVSLDKLIKERASTMSELCAPPPQFMCWSLSTLASQNVNLETGSLPLYLTRMRSYWCWVALNPNCPVSLWKGEIGEQTHKVAARRRWRLLPVNWGRSSNSWNRCSLTALKRKQPGKYNDFRLTASGTVSQYISVV